MQDHTRHTRPENAKNGQKRHKTYEARKRQKWPEKVIQGQTGPFKVTKGHIRPHMIK